MSYKAAVAVALGLMQIVAGLICMFDSKMLYKKNDWKLKYYERYPRLYKAGDIIIGIAAIFMGAFFLIGGIEGE